MVFVPLLSSIGGDCFRWWFSRSPVIALGVIYGKRYHVWDEDRKSWSETCRSVETMEVVQQWLLSWLRDWLAMRKLDLINVVDPHC